MQKIYLVDMKNIIDENKKNKIMFMSDNEFKEEAEEQGMTFEIEEFINVFNIGADIINNQHQYIRMLKESEE